MASLVAGAAGRACAHAACAASFAAARASARSAGVLHAAAAGAAAPSASALASLWAQDGGLGIAPHLPTLMVVPTPLDLPSASLPSWSHLPSETATPGVAVVDGVYYGEEGRFIEAPASDSSAEEMWAMNRNMREPRKANHGARPCSSIRRRRKYKTRANPHPYIPAARREKGSDK